MIIRNSRGIRSTRSFHAHRQLPTTSRRVQPSTMKPIPRQESTLLAIPGSYPRDNVPRDGEIPGLSSTEATTASPITEKCHPQAPPTPGTDKKFTSAHHSPSHAARSSSWSRRRREEERLSLLIAQRQKLQNAIQRQDSLIRECKIGILKYSHTEQHSASRLDHENPGFEGVGQREGGNKDRFGGGTWKRGQGAQHHRQDHGHSERAEETNVPTRDKNSCSAENETVRHLSLYELKWEAIKTGKDADGRRIEAISGKEFPWPVHSLSSLTANFDTLRKAIREFVLDKRRPGCENRSAGLMVKKELARWHPDRFKGYSLLISEGHRDDARKVAGNVAAALNAIMSGL